MKHFLLLSTAFFLAGSHLLPVHADLSDSESEDGVLDEETDAEQEAWHKRWVENMQPIAEHHARKAAEHAHLQKVAQDAGDDLGGAAHHGILAQRHRQASALANASIDEANKALEAYQKGARDVRLAEKVDSPKDQEALMNRGITSLKKQPEHAKAASDHEIALSELREMLPAEERAKSFSSLG